MKPEKERLLDDLLGAGSRREATLCAGAQILRHRRHWRAARFALMSLLLTTAVTWLILPNCSAPKTTPVITLGKTTTPPPVPVLNDAQLLALFPNTPVALITLSSGKKVLFFPRPADEARYVVHL